MLLYNIEQIPKKLKQVLDQQEIVFIVKARKEPVLWLSTLWFTLVIMFSLLFYAYYFSKEFLSLSKNNLWNFISVFWMVILLTGILSFLYLLRGLGRDFVNYLLKLIWPSPIFAGTKDFLIIYQNKQIFMIAWKFFNPTTIVEIGFFGRGDLILRLYYKENIINAYDGKIYHPKEVIMTEIDNVEKISDICEKFIYKAQEQWA